MRLWFESLERRNAVSSFMLDLVPLGFEWDDVALQDNSLQYAAESESSSLFYSNAQRGVRRAAAPTLATSSSFQASASDAAERVSKTASAFEHAASTNKNQTTVNHGAVSNLVFANTAFSATLGRQNLLASVSNSMELPSNPLPNSQWPSNKSEANTFSDASRESVASAAPAFATNTSSQTPLSGGAEAESAQPSYYPHGALDHGYDLSLILPNLTAQQAQQQEPEPADVGEGLAPVSPLLDATEVAVLLDRAAAASASEEAIIAVVDRGGRILGVRVEAGVSTSDIVFAIDGAVAKARTAAFFSSDQAPLTSRTVRFISQSTITQREVQSNPSIPDLTSTIRGPGFVAPIGLGGHFPPEIPFTPFVDLFAIEHTNRDSIVHPGPNRVKETVVLAPNGSVLTTTGDDIAFTSRFGADYAAFAPNEAITAPESYGFVSGTNTAAQARGIATLPGGIPLFRNSKLVGGIGVFFPGPDGYADFEQGFVPGIGQTEASRTNAPLVLEAEYIAFAAADSGTIAGIPAPSGFALPQGRIDLAGIKLEIYGPHPAGLSTLLTVGAGLGVGNPASGANQVVNTLGDTTINGKFIPEGWLVLPKAAPDGSLSAAEVEKILNDAVAEAKLVRAGIRLPIGRRTKMVMSVTDKEGEVLGLFRMTDATYFSVDVAVAKARNVAYYADAADIENIDRVDQNGDGTPDVAAGVAFTNRTYRFLAEPYFPSGIDGTGGGAFSILRDPGVDPATAENLGAPAPANVHATVLGFDAFNPGSNFREPVPATGFQNGIVFFPGSTPLYKNGILVGGLGVSGDGVDQDDVVTFVGGGDFRPGPASGVTRADQVFVDGVRLPYQKFLRNPHG